ncbi:LysE family translocator [Rhodobacter capsulatus]|uniref:LysE family translocator n=1 Tax=Rhodobacter capsulatus TaxID=1061 RepID=UPI00402A10F8
MDALVLFGKGLFIGLAIAAPIGPMGALCIQRTLARGFWAGVAGGLGTALADLTFATGAAVGFAVFKDLVERIAVPLGLIGGAFLMWLAWNGWPRGQAGEPSPAQIPEGARAVAHHPCHLWADDHQPADDPFVRGDLCRAGAGADRIDPWPSWRLSRAFSSARSAGGRSSRAWSRRSITGCRLPSRFGRRGSPA